MLVLTRRAGEEVFIDTPGGERVVVRVCQVNGEKIKIGVDAPEAFSVNRREIAEEMQLRKAASVNRENQIGSGAR